jgi:hypothetical protein
MPARPTRTHRTRSLLLALALLAAAALAPAPPASAQEPSVEIYPFVGWQAGGSFELVEGDTDVAGDASYGFGFGVRLAPTWLVEFLYGRQETELAAVSGFFGQRDRLFDLTVQHFHGAINWELMPGKVRPFLTLGAGASGFDPDGERQSEWFFSGSLGGGVKLLFNDNFGLRLQARYLPVVLESDSDVFCPTLGTCFVSTDQTTTSQGEVSAGLLLRF